MLALPRARAWCSPIGADERAGLRQQAESKPSILKMSVFLYNKRMICSDASFMPIVIASWTSVVA